MKKGEIIITFVIIGLVIFVLKDIDFIKVWYLLKKINFLYFSFAFLSLFGTFLLWNLRFQKALSRFVKVGYWFLFSVFMTGFFMSTITPGARVGGEPIRVYFLNKKYKKSAAKLLGITLAEKFINLLAFFLFLGFSILFVLSYIKISEKLRFILEIIFLLIFLFLGFMVFILWGNKKINLTASNLYNVKFIRKRFPTKGKFKKYAHRKINEFFASFRNVVKDKKILLFGFIVSFLGWILNYLSSYFLFLALGFGVDFFSVLIVVTFSYLAGDISPSPGGIGVIESSMFLIYSAMGIVPEVALAVSLLSRAIYYFYTIGVGGIFLLLLKLKDKKLKRKRLLKVVDT